MPPVSSTLVTLDFLSDPHFLAYLNGMFCVKNFYVSFFFVLTFFQYSSSHCPILASHKKAS